MKLSTSTVVKTKGKQRRTRFSPAFWLKGRVENPIDVWKISDRLDVNPSTIQKILEGRPISRSVTQKIEAAHARGALNGNGAGRRRESKRSTLGRMMEAYRLYQKENSLRRVGKKLGVSHERARQLLEKGSEIGLFKYEPAKPPTLSRKRILDDYRRFLKRDQVARANQISPYTLSKLMALRRITTSDLEAIRREEWRRQCIERYRALAASLGRRPTQAELFRSKSTRSLAFKIRRLWGSFEAFRRERNGAPAWPSDRTASR